MSNTQPSSRRRILLLVVLVGVVAAVGGAGTYAFLSSEEGVGVSLTSGNLELVIIDDETLDFNGTDGEPKTASVSVKNNGSLDAGEVAWTELSLGGNTSLASSAKIQNVSYRGTNITANVTADGRDDVQALSDYLAQAGNSFALESLVDGDGLQGGGEDVATLEITVEIDYTNVNGSSSQTLTGEARLVSKQISP